MAYYGFQYVFGQRIAIDVNTCDIQLLARSYFNPKEYVTLCAECKDQYVLSFDLQTCILYSEFAHSSYQYCKRIGRDGITCIEAKCTIQINELGDFVSVQYGNNNEDCAKFDTQSGKCLYPRFGFELNLDTQQIIENTDTYCALRKSSVCIEYHSAFIDTQQGYSVFPDSFQNADQIDTVRSTAINIFCLENYEIVSADAIQDPTSTGVAIPNRAIYGCGLILYKVPHCIAYDIRRRLCIQCEKGYSLNINGRECILFDHCVSHRNYYGIYICIKCQPMYYLYNNHCVALKYCDSQDINGSCAFCLFPYYGYMCESINKTVPDECELLNRYGNCVKCKNNDLYFWHIFNQRCELRKLSIHCIRKSYISDQCDSFECDDGYLFNVAHYEIYYGVFRQYQAYSCDYLIKDTTQNQYWYWYDYNYYDYGQQMHSVRDTYYYKYHFNLGSFEEQPYCILRQKKIEGCLIYDGCFESCAVCIAGLSLVQDQSGTSDYYYRFICQKIETTDVAILKIEHCIKYDTNGRCLACEDYYTNFYDHCEIGSIKNCKTYGDSNNCIQCEQNYALFNNQCFYVELCLEYQWVKINVFCKRCIERPDTAISLVQTSSLFRSDCVINLPNDFCAFYVDNICMRCIRGYVLVEGTNRCIKNSLVKPQNNCLKCDQTLHCIECIPGYRLVIINGAAYCIKVYGSCVIRKSCDISRCSIDCQGLYINYQPTCQYQCPVNQGIFYGYCIKCSDYFGEGCDTCSNNFVCDRCRDGYFWDQDSRRCKYKCPNGQIVDSIYQCNNCQVQNCQSCSTADVCTACINNFFLQNNVCVDKCSDGFNTLVGTPPQPSICYQCPSGCLACAVDAQNNIYCTKCATDLFLDNGKCVDRCTFYALGQNCTNICQNFVLDGQCVDKCPFYYVQKINEDGIQARICIATCDYFTYVDNKQECANGQCRQGYFADPATRQCVKCQVDHCLQCSTGTNICTLCDCGYFLKDGKCLYVCQDSLRLVNDPYECLRCYQRGCANDCYYDNGCTSCVDNYVLENKTCRCPTEQGYTLEYPGICRPPQPPNCLDPNCVSCSPYSYCHQCKLGYYLIYMGINAAGQEVNACVQQCPQGFYLQNGVCYPCSSNCVSCTSFEICRQCKDGYVPVIKYMRPGNSIYGNRLVEFIQCMFKCRDGTLVSDPRQCKCHFACIDCDRSFCLNCATGYLATSDGQCSNTSCQARKCKQCVPGAINQCQDCEDRYQLDQGVCRFVCPDGTLSQSDNDLCPRIVKCEVPGCIYCPDDIYTCRKCDPTLALFHNQCRPFCEVPKPWEDDFIYHLNICINCPYPCAACDENGNCTSCKGNNTLENKCLCPAGYVLYRERCIKKCPFYSDNINNQYCLKYCIDGLSPYYTVNRLMRQCEKVLGENSNFCIQNIENIPDILSVSIDPFDKGADSFQIRISLESTPSSCYQYILRGINNNQFTPQILVEDDDSLQLGVILPQMDALKNVLDCSGFQCVATLEVYFAEVIQYVINITINLDLTLILTNGIQYQGNFATFNAVCPTCIIPATLTISTSIKTICPSNNVCTGDSIKTITNSEITVIQVIADPRFFNNKIQPHSLRLVYTNAKGEEITLFINNYLYDNSILGQISYTFKAIALKSGTLIVTSIVNNANYQSGSTRMLAQGSSGTFYPQYKISLQMLEDQTAQSSNVGNTVIVKENTDNSTAIIVGAAVGGAVLLLILGIVFYKLYTKNSKKNKYLRAQSSMKISEAEIAHPSENVDAPKKQEQIIVQDDQKEIRIPSIAEHL